MTTEPNPPTAVRGRWWEGWIVPLAGLSLLWLLGALIPVRLSLGTAYADLQAPDTLALAPAAFGVPTLISASLIAGAAAGLAVIRLRFRRPPTTAGRSRRAVLGAATGLLVGAAVAVPTAAGYAGLPAPVLLLAGTAAVTAGAGGLLAGLLRSGVLAAALAGTLAVFVVGFVAGLVSGNLLDQFGGQTATSILAANRWAALISALVAGLAAGTIGYGYLRRYLPEGPRWPTYLLVGAVPGLVLLLTEAVTRLAGAPLFRLLGASPSDEAILRALGEARLNRALVVLFAGALVAIFLLGRSLTQTEDDDREADEAQSSTS